MSVTTTNTDIGLAVPNVGLDTPDPEKPTRKLLYAILIDYLQGIKALETGKLSTSVIAQELGHDAGKVVSQAILTDILQNLSFAQLADTPFAYVGSAGKALRVNSAQDGIEFFSLADVATSGNYNDLINKPDLNSIPQIVTAANFAALPAIGDVTKTYLTLDDGKLFFWTGSAYQNFTNETATWAGIGGSISDNVALQGELDAKANAADVALKTTSFYAGAGLAGGGDLSQDRTLNVDFGTGAGQAMAGDDARVAGLQDAAYSIVGIDIAPLGQDGLVPSAHLPAQFSGDYDDLTNKPTLFSGAYDDLSGKPTLGTVAPLDVDTDVNLAANSDALIPSQKAVKAYVDNNAGGVTLKPWTPATYVPIDLVTPIDYAGNGLTATLTGSTVSVTGNSAELANGLVSDAGVLSTTQANNLYFKMGASAGFYVINSTYVGFVDATSIVGISNFVKGMVSFDPPTSTMGLIILGNQTGNDSTYYSPALEIPTSSANSEFCLSYMPVGGTNGFGYVALYVDGEYVAQHDLTKAADVDRVIVCTHTSWNLADPSNTAWIECLNNPAYPIAGLDPLFIGSSAKLDETAYPINATSNIFEITGTPTPLQWDAIGGTVVDGDLVAFDSAGVPFVVDVTATDLSNYYTKSESDSALNTKVTKPIGFDEATGDEFKYISGRGTLKDVSTIQKLGNMPDVVFSTENATVDGNPIGYDALVMLDKSTWGFGLVTNLANTQVENSLIVLAVENTAYQLGNTVYIPSDGGSQATNKVIADRMSGSGTHSNHAYTLANSYNSPNSAGIYAVCEWDAVTKEEISREVIAYGETFIWIDDDNGTSDSTISRLVQTIPATPTSSGKRGQLAADADYLYYCYAQDSWATVPKSAFKTAFLDDATSDGKTYARKDGAWVEVDKPQTVETVTAHRTLTAADNNKILLISAGGLQITLPAAVPNFNVDIVKMDDEFLTAVAASGTDKFRDGVSTIVVVKDVTIFSTGVVGKEYVAIGDYVL